MDNNRTRDLLLVLLVGILIWYLFRAERKHALSMNALSKMNGGTDSLPKVGTCAGSPADNIAATVKIDQSDPEQISPGTPPLENTTGGQWYESVASAGAGFNSQGNSSFESTVV
jgi:hypothetical protein